MAQRRTKRRRRRGRGSFGPLLRLLSIVLTAVVIVIALTLFFKVDHIDVSGNGRYSAEEITAVSGVEIGGNLILLDKYQIAREIYTRLPYITDVRLKRQLPDGLLIEVAETRSVMAAESAGAWWLISEGGKILEALESEPEGGHLLLRGMAAATPAVGQQLTLDEEGNLSAERLLELVAALSERGMLEKAQSVDASDPKNLVMRYDERFDVEIFYDADFEFKLDCLRSVVNELEPNETGVIRMTMDDENEVRLIPYGP